MQKKLLAAALGTLFAMPVLAEDGTTTQHKEDIHVIPASAHTVTSNVALVTDYLYRGITQTNAKPAIQGGFDYSHSSGFYAGLWGSSISWLTDQGTASSSQLELDTYFGFKNSFANDFTYDVGFLRYNYPAKYPATMATVIGTTTWAKADTNEVYGQIGYKFVSLKYSYSLGDTFALPNARGTSYIDLSANYPIADTGITLGAHYGKQSYKGSTADALKAANTDPSYSDYKLSITKDFSGYVVGLAYSATNVKDNQFYSYAGANANKNLGQGTAVLTLSRSF
jgi:uncharacterized protein (TIGR02001 family)